MTNIDAYRAFVEEFHDELITSAFRGFTSAPHLTQYSNIKGKKVFTLGEQADVLKAFSTTYSASANNTPTVVTLDTHRFNAEMDLVPSEFEDSYLGRFIPEGQRNDVGSIGFFRSFIDQFLLRIQHNMERVVWNGATGGSGYLAVFDGFGEQIKDAVTATSLTAVATGVLDASTIIADIEGMYDQLYDPLKDDPTKQVKVYVPRLWKDTYARAYRDAVTKYTDEGTVKTTVFGTTAEIVAVDALSGTNKALVTTQDNLVVGMDSPGDSANIFIKPEHYHIEHSVTLKLGAKILRATDGYAVVNDQW